MKETEISVINLLLKHQSLLEQGWIPMGRLDKNEMLFMKNGKLYDLSAADLTRLDYIEEKGLFVKEDFNEIKFEIKV